MRENKSENGQTGEKKGGNGSAEGRNEKSRFSGLSPLVNLLPAALVIVLVGVTLPMTEPVLREIPELLTIDAKASESLAETEGETEPESEAFAQGDFEDGVYKGTGTGYGGAITVEVTVENRSIVSVKILSAPGETASFLKRAEAVIDSVIQSQSWEVDVVSGATYSSKGILAAIQNALTGEKVESETAPVQKTEPLVKTEFEEPEGYVDGTYYGSARGFGGTIQVKVVISGGKIAGISIVSASGETPSYLSSAKAVIGRMLSAQSPNVDTVSGATYSSNGIINAVKTALRQAAGSGISDDLTVDEDTADKAAGGAADSSKPEKKPVIEKTEAPADGYVDGVYTGTAEGFGGDITVQVTISGGKIVSVDILSAEDETPSYLKQAEAVTGRIVAAQSTDVDVVSGATYSSTGIINAAAEALNKAKPAAGEKNPDEESTGNPGSENEENSNAENSGSENTVQPDSENTGNPDTEQAGSESTGSEEISARYQDGIYQASALCADEDTFIYTVKVSASIEEGKIEEINVEKLDDQSEFPEDNDVYLDYAINGRTRKNVWYEGVVKQILTAQSADQIDVVSSATYSSNAIIAAAQEALELAAIKENDAETEAETENPETSETPETSEDGFSLNEETPAEDEGIVSLEGITGKIKSGICSILMDFFNKMRFYA